jgi:hypothetical protein
LIEEWGRRNHRMTRRIGSKEREWIRRFGELDLQEGVRRIKITGLKERGRGSDRRVRRMDFKKGTMEVRIRRIGLKERKVI